jgi:hypothetical protein
VDAAATSAQALAQRARIVLLAAKGLMNTEIGGVSRKMAATWRSRFAERCPRCRDGTAARRQRGAKRWHDLALLVVANSRRHAVRPAADRVTKPRSDASAALQAANQLYRRDGSPASQRTRGCLADRDRHRRAGGPDLRSRRLGPHSRERGRARRLTEEQVLSLEHQRLALEDAQRLARVGSWS